MSWPAVPVTEVARVVGGATPKSAIEEFWDGDVNWVTPKDLSNLDGKYIAETPRKITAQGLRSCAAELLPANSVLFSSRAPIGHVAINAEPMATNQGFKSFVPSPELDASFLYWWLDANRRYLQSLGTGATFKEVSKAVVQRIKIPLPPLEEQRRIAGILDQADALRRLRTRALDKLNTLGQAIFHEMFGDPATNPMGWDVVPIGQLGVVQGGLQVSRKREVHALRKPYLRVANVYRDLLNLAEVKEIGLTESEFERVKLQVGDVLIVEGHGNPEEIGRTSVWNGEVEDCVHQNHLIRFRANKSLVLPEFLSCLLNSSSGRRRLNSTSNTTSGLNTISTKKVKEAEVPLPPVAKQAEFLERFSAAQQEIEKFDTASQQFDGLFASLQHRAFRGEL